MINKILILILLMSLFACSSNKDAKLSINKIEKKRTTEGVYYENVDIINTGEVPALFVILIGKAYWQGKELQTVEKGYGDIYPGETKTFPIAYHNLGKNDPDSIIYRITYSQSDNNPIR
jgi:hypothetical protein